MSEVTNHNDHHYNNNNNNNNTIKSPNIINSYHLPTLSFSNDNDNNLINTINNHDFVTTDSLQVHKNNSYPTLSTLVNNRSNINQNENNNNNHNPNNLNHRPSPSMPPNYIFSAQVMKNVNENNLDLNIGDILHILSRNEVGGEPETGFYYGIKNSLWNDSITISQFSKIILKVPGEYLKPLDEFL